MSAALELQDVSAWYGNARIISNASLSVAAGEVVALIGRNGAGKTSLLRAAMGLMPRCTGSVLLDGMDVSRLPPFRRAQMGLGYVPEDRRIFTDLTVAENLRIAARQQEGGLTEARSARTCSRTLRDMLHRPASAMSGGEQQMLAVARTLAANPSVVLLDEPSEGIAPLVVAKMREAVLAMKSRGVATLVSEQNVRFAAAIADRAVLIELGRVVGRSDACRHDLALSAPLERKPSPPLAPRRVPGVVANARHSPRYVCALRLAARRCAAARVRFDGFTELMIISSLLDTDLYKFTMMQVVLHHFPGASVEYRFNCRNPGIDLVPHIDAINDEIESLCTLRFRESELQYLRGLRFIKSDFVDFLGLFQLNTKYITVKPSPLSQRRNRHRDSRPVAAYDPVRSSRAGDRQRGLLSRAAKGGGLRRGAAPAARQDRAAERRSRARWCANRRLRHAAPILAPLA